MDDNEKYEAAILEIFRQNREFDAIRDLLNGAEKRHQATKFFLGERNDWLRKINQINKTNRKKDKEIDLLSSISSMDGKE